MPVFIIISDIYVIPMSKTDCLEKSGLKVWVDVTGLSAGTDFLNKIGQAIIDSKVLYNKHICIYICIYIYIYICIYVL